MDKDTRAKVWKDAEDIYGIDSQLDMVQEECAELIQAISKLRRKKYGAKELVIEECADVENIVSHIIAILDIRKKVDVVKDAKLKRLRNRIEKAKG